MRGIIIYIYNVTHFVVFLVTGVCQSRAQNPGDDVRQQRGGVLDVLFRDIREDPRLRPTKPVTDSSNTWSTRHR